MVCWIPYVLLGLAFISKADGRDSICDRSQITGRPPCSQICEEDTDIYTCSCKAGYRIDHDDNQCYINGDEPVLFYQRDVTLKVMYLDSYDVAVVMDTVRPIQSMAFGPNKTVFWLEENYSAVKKAQMDEKYQAADVTIVVDTGLVYPNSLTVDWVSSILYILDDSRIIGCTTDGGNCSILVSKLTHPQDLKIHRQSSKLLWINQSPHGSVSCTIHTAELDGSGHMVLMSGIKHPRSLVIDETIDALVWISGEGHDQVVQTMYLTGHGQRHKYTLTLSEGHKTGLSILGDLMYLTGEGHIEVIDKFTGETIETHELPRLVSSTIYHPELYRSPHTDNPCQQSRCSHLCLRRQTHHRAESTCRCPASMYPLPSTQCTEKDTSSKPRIIISSLGGIFELVPDFIGPGRSGVKVLTNQSAECLAYDSLRKELIFYDSKISAIMAADLTSPRLTTTVLYKDILYVESIAVNVFDNTLFWTTLHGKIYTVHRERAKLRVLYEDFNQPRGMAIDGKNGLMYVCDWGGAPSIYQCDVYGHHCVHLLLVPGGHPNMIILENGNQLYWSDSKADRIGSLNLKTNKTSEILLPNDRNHHPVCIQKAGDQIYYTDWNTGQLHSLHKDNPAVINDLQLHLGSLYGLVIIPPVKKATVNDDVNTVNYEVMPTVGSSTEDYTEHIIPNQKHKTPLLVLGLEELTTKAGLDDGTIKVPLVTQRPTPSKTDTMDVGIILLIILLSSGLCLIAAVVIWLCYCRRKHKDEDGWMVKLVKVVKSGDREEDGEQLLGSSAHISNKPSFKHYDDVDYPDSCKEMRNLDVNKNRRDVSMLSRDSAFTEIHDSGSTACLIDSDSDYHYIN